MPGLSQVACLIPLFVTTHRQDVSICHVFLSISVLWSQLCLHAVLASPSWHCKGGTSLLVAWECSRCASYQYTYLVVEWAPLFLRAHLFHTCYKCMDTVGDVQGLTFQVTPYIAASLPKLAAHPCTCSFVWWWWSRWGMQLGEEISTKRICIYIGILTTTHYILYLVYISVHFTDVPLHV